jgi:rare lipoprotein A
MSLKSPLAIWLFAGTSTVVAAGGLVFLYTPAVHADARLPRPASTAPPAVPILSPTPAALAQQKTKDATRSDKLRSDKIQTDKLQGIASWYGAVLDGHMTASGERFDMYAMTACHPTLPFGTLVKVVDKTTKRSVVVRINDRGILSDGRIIDLSYAAAEQLKIVKAGLASVDVEVISLGHPRHHKKVATE